MKVLVYAACALSGAVLTSTLMLARTPPPVSYAAAPDCSTSETGAQRCDRALLTCLSVQVRMLHQIESLETVCTKESSK